MKGSVKTDRLRRGGRKAKSVDLPRLHTPGPGLEISQTEGSAFAIVLGEVTVIVNVVSLVGGIVTLEFDAPPTVEVWYAAKHVERVVTAAVAARKQTA